MSAPIEGWELSSYVDGDLPPERMAEIEAAAEQMPELARRLQEMLADHRALGVLAANARTPVGDLPPALARLTSQLSRRLRPSPDRPSAGSPAGAVGGAAARAWRHVAMLTAGAAVGWAAASWASAPTGDTLLEFVDEATEIHRVAMMAPDFSREVSGHVLDGLGALFAHEIVPPDFSGAGFTLSRVDVAAIDTGPAAVLYYTDPEARRLSLVLSLDAPFLDALAPGAAGHDAGSRAGVAPRVTTHDGLSVSYGQGDGIAYAVVGLVPEPRVLQLAVRVAESLVR